MVKKISTGLTAYIPLVSGGESVSGSIYLSFLLCYQAFLTCLVCPLMSFKKIWFYLFLAVLGSLCFVGLSLVAASRGSSPAAVRGLRIAKASLAAERWL